MIDTAVRNLIRQRAGERCEYCRLPEHAVDIPFHVEHIIAKQHGGEDDPSNLCLACDRWREHFTIRGAEIEGLTPTGRATVRLLNMNARPRLRLRLELLAQR